MNILVPHKFFAEKEYIIRQLLSYLSLPEYSITPTNDQWYTIVNKENKILIKDQFFARVEGESYLSEEYLPQSVVQLTSNQFFENKDLVFFFGMPHIQTTGNEIRIEADIFASAFYLLSRWEEKVIRERDGHDRFPDKANILVRNGLHYRPVVCEYVGFLRNLLHAIGVRAELKRQYSLRVTHDVDFLRRFGSFMDFARGAVNDIVRRRSLRYFFKTIGAYASVQLKGERDPYDTFDFLMDVSEENNTVSEFYFIPSRIDEPFAFYDYRNPIAAEKVKHILERGHIVGLHGSYRAHRNRQYFFEEINRFYQTWGFRPEKGRQHFLRFSVPETWRIWSEAGLKEHSSIGFISHAGFRAGMCYPYQVFDVVQRRALELIESPLVLMEVGLLKETQDDFNDFWNKAMELYRQVKRYKGNFVLLWHNNSFGFGKFYDKQDFYRSLVKELSR